MGIRFMARNNFDLGIFKSLYLKKLKIMTYIFNKTDIILAQSETYVDLIKTKVKIKKYFFPSWPEIQEENINLMSY